MTRSTDITATITHWSECRSLFGGRIIAGFIRSPVSVLPEWREIGPVTTVEHIPFVGEVVQVCNLLDDRLYLLVDSQRDWEAERPQRQRERQLVKQPR